ncbi:hypothetical protein DSO57_1034491 [Entomophthora muscae]|uniref:Uncharacterized protein n=1 Tax=Entomophthora muscae TaxID=34485 RepID=A0ACC2TYD2_9FUNG|nr:hypothetical protein DSO57_1034491 [Entomophthora muscae]
MKYRREIYEQAFRYYFKGMDGEAFALSTPYEFLKLARYFRELAGEFFSDEKVVAEYTEAFEREHLLYITVQGLGDASITEFKAIPSYQFVTVVPKETEKYYSRFLQLPEELRNALTEGTVATVDTALKGISPGDLHKALTSCAIGGFFYFQSTIKPRDFGFMSKAVEAALKKLA